MKKGDIFNLVEKFPKEISRAYFLDIPFYYKKFDRIVIVGMGGSYIAGLTLKEFLRDEIKIPFEVYAGELPYINEKTLVFLISYSGNTKEVINIYKKIKNAHILVVTSGGKLLQLARKHKCSIIKLPSNLHERFTFAYGFFPVLKFFENCHLIKDKREIVFKIFETLNRNKSHLIRESQELALKLKNKYPLFYGSNYFYPVCYRMQTSIEEDAKIICHSNKITELFHNELEANPTKDFYPFLIIDKEESIKYKKQISFFKKIIKNYFEFKFEKHAREERMFLLFYFTDFLGYYLSKLKKTPMGKTPLSDKIKRK